MRAAASKARGSNLNVIVLSVFGMILAPALFAGLILHMVDRQNEIANVERTRQAQGLLGSFVAASNYTIVDNSVWDEAFRKVVLETDRDWFHENLGFEVFESVSYQASLVVNRDGSVWTGSWEDAVISWVPGKRLGDTYRKLIRRLIDTPDLGLVSSFVEMEGGLVYFAAREIAPLNGQRLDATQRKYMLFLYRFDAALVDSLGEIGGWDDLGLSIAPPSGPALPIADADGRPVGYLTWDYPRPGYVALRETAPFIIAAFVLAGVSVVGLFVRVVGTNRRLKAARRAALKLADHDALTGIANRRKLQRVVAAALEAGAPFQMLIIDFDGFKEVNDRLGHKLGDALLIEMTRRMLRLCPRDGLLARTGGDEFALLYNGTIEAATELGRDLIFAISAPFEVPGQTISISASVGVATGEADMAGDEVIHRADVAMYEAKQHKPGAVRRYHERLDQDARLRADLDLEMREGLDRGDFWVAYQPIYSVAEERIVSVEALARWTHPERGVIGPNVFIPVAEQSRFIIPLGEFVLRAACAAYAGAGETKVSVNLSPVQLLDDLLVDKITAILAETGFPAARLELEITEGYLIEQTDRAAEVMNRLRALGLLISLDDFGAGYASLGYLRRFPLDKVKIDRSFIDTLGSDEKATEVVAAVVALCRAFGMPITAEGVETVEQADLLRAMGCDLLQGYLIGRPGPKADAEPEARRIES